MWTTSKQANPSIICLLIQWHLSESGICKCFLFNNMKLRYLCTLIFSKLAFTFIIPLYSSTTNEWNNRVIFESKPDIISVALLLTWQQLHSLLQLVIVRPYIKEDRISSPLTITHLKEEGLIRACFLCVLTQRSSCKFSHIS